MKIEKISYVLTTLAVIGMTILPINSLRASSPEDFEFASTYIAIETKQTINNTVTINQKNCFYIRLLRFWWCIGDKLR